MTADSIRRPSRRKPAHKPERPAKPNKDFPLYAHKFGCWAKKVRGKTAYFTKWSEDRKGVAALELWLDQKDDLLAGRIPRKKDPNAVTVADLSSEYLTHQAE